MTRITGRVLGHTSTVLGLKVLHASIMFLTSALVSRGLGPEGRGVYYTPLLAATTAVALCHLGLDQANVYLWGSRRVPLSKLVGQAGVVAAVSGVLGGLGLAAFAAIAPDFFRGIPWSMVGVAAVMVPFGVHAVYATGLLTLQGRVTAPVIAAVAGAILQLVLLGGLALLDAFSPPAVFGAAAGTGILTSAALAAVLSRSGRLFTWDRTLLRESLAHSLVLHLGMALLFLHLRVDMFLVKALLGTAALGLYSLAVVLAESLMLIADSLGTVLTPRQMEGSLREAAATALAGARVVAIVGIVLTLAWAALGWLVIRLAFGESFAGVFVPLLVLLPGIVLLGMQRICGPTVLRAGRPWRLTTFQAAGFAMNVVLNLLWIPEWGLAGAAAASTISYAVIALGFLAWTGRLSGESITGAIPGRADIVRVFEAVHAFRRPQTATER